MLRVYIGYDPREITAFYVACHSLVRHLEAGGVQVFPLELNALIESGFYTRPIERRDGLLYDPISAHPMATEFAISRFFTPYLAAAAAERQPSWALFMDCDMLVRCDINELFDRRDSRYAVMCVKHEHAPTSVVKMDKQVQSNYARKNWSSVMLWNVAHPAHQRLSLRVLNSYPGRDLHRFCWLKDEEIGALPLEYNYLVGTYTRGKHLNGREPKIVHFTDGIPHMRGYEDCEYAEEWRAELKRVTRKIVQAVVACPA